MAAASRCHNRPLAESVAPRSDSAGRLTADAETADLREAKALLEELA